MSDVVNLRGSSAWLPPAQRLAPHNIEVEQALLGAILINNDAFYRVSDFLEPQHFYEPAHQRLFELIGNLIRASKIANPITLKTFLPPDLEIAGLTASQYLARLAAEATTVINAVDYGRTIYDLALRRGLIAISQETADGAYDASPEITPGDQIEAAERKLFELAQHGRYDGGFQTLAQHMATMVDMVAHAYQHDGKLSGLATGLADLDRILGGLQNSDLVILAGRPGMGKTALATNIAYNIARALVGKQAHGVAFFSLEMSGAQVAARITSEQIGVASSALRRGNFPAADFEKIKDLEAAHQTLPLYIDETGGLSIARLVARARRLKRQRGLDLLVVDYIQLLQGSSHRAQQGRVQEITEITTSLKALAKELNVPILAISQLSRQVESREDKRPQLSDLRESGSIEQDADVVLFVFREEYYLKNREPRPGTEDYFKWQAEMEAVHGKADVIVGKHRHGPTGTVTLQFEPSLTRFSDLAHDPQ